jgi:hypothetical protein
MIFNVQIEGTAPMIMGRFPIEDGIPRTSAKKGSSDKVSQEAARSLYYDDEIGLFIPADHIPLSMRTGCKMKQLKIRTRVAWPLITKGVSVSPDRVPVVSPADWFVYTCTVLNRTTGSRQLHHRPRINEWMMAFTLAVNEEILPVEIAERALSHAGLVDGMGTFRSKFGSFKVTKWEEQK